MTCDKLQWESPFAGQWLPSVPSLCRDSVDKLPSCAPASSTTMGFQGRSGEKLLLSDIGGKDMELDSLIDCEVTVHGSPAALFARRLINCRLQCGPVASAVFVESCEGCTFQVACQQLRVHDSHRCQFQVHIQARSIIENSDELLFGQYSFSYDGDERDWAAAGLDRAVNHWDQVDDFNWLTPDKPSPNWQPIDDVHK